MILSFIACSSCGCPRPEHFALCEVCAKSLVTCPELCSQCGSPVCGSACRRPWAPLWPLQSMHARYLFLGLGHEVLKAWKFRGGPLMDREVLRLDDGLRAKLETLELRAIVPVPQSFKRAWQLNGSSSGRVAIWLSRELGVPLRGLLTLDARPGAGSSPGGQTGRRADERFLARQRFAAAGPECLAAGAGAARTGPRDGILLVDDFGTTGHTLRAAARALGSRGWQNVHGFCLGLKLRRLEKQSRDLGQSAGWAVAVGEKGGIRQGGQALGSHDGDP